MSIRSPLSSVPMPAARSSAYGSGRCLVRHLATLRRSCGDATTPVINNTLKIFYTTPASRTELTAAATTMIDLSILTI